MAEPLDLCTDAERKHMCAVGTKWTGDNTVTVIHPTRLHHEFVNGPRNKNNTLLTERNLGDGYVEVTYELHYGVAQ